MIGQWCEFCGQIVNDEVFPVEKPLTEEEKRARLKQKLDDLC